MEDFEGGLQEKLKGSIISRDSRGDFYRDFKGDYKGSFKGDFCCIHLKDFETQSLQIQLQELDIEVNFKKIFALVENKLINIKYVFDKSLHCLKHMNAHFTFYILSNSIKGCTHMYIFSLGTHN